MNMREIGEGVFDGPARTPLLPAVRIPFTSAKIIEQMG
jgi:hypothetical protein